MKNIDLIDYFAGQAIANDSIAIWSRGDVAAAQKAYSIAREMLKERQRLIDAGAIKGEHTAEQPVSLAEGEYLVPAYHTKTPSFDVLKHHFDWVSELHKNTWDNDGEQTQNLVMFVKQFDTRISSEEAIKWADENGYRVATRVEAINFSIEQPELQRQFPIVALGSSASWCGSRLVWRQIPSRIMVYVAVLSEGDGGRRFGNGIFEGEWYSHYRFLFVKQV